MKRNRIRKISLITLSVIVILVTVIILFISPLTKYLVEKYDEKILGRQIKMDMAYVNPFTGYVFFDDVRVYEANSDSVFLYSDGISANFTVFKLLSGVYEITHIKLNRPVATFIQKDSTTLNLDDIIERFSPKDTTIRVTPKKVVHFAIESIIIEDGEFRYIEQTIPVYYTIKKVNIESTGFQWDNDTTGIKFSFISGNNKGDVAGKITINTKNQDYRLATKINKYDLKFIEQYVMDFTKYGNFDADLDADIRATGNFKDAEKLDANGIIAVNKFRFGKKDGEDYATFDKLVFDITRLNPAAHIYTFDSAILTRPFMKYERYDHMDNFSMMFGVGGQNVSAAKASSSFNLIFEVADYVAILAKNFFKSNYKVNKVAIVDANLKFNDFALNEKFSANVSPLNLFADSIAKNKDRAKVKVWSGLKPYGQFNISISINPKDSSDFDLYYSIDKLPTAMFNPYLITYTSFPMDRGTIEVKGNWHVRNGYINSDNHLLVIDPRLGKRVKKKDAKRLPLPLIMYFVRERGNVIDYEIPISGNLNEPKFHLRDVVLDVLTNIFVKPPTTGYRIKVKQVEKEIEKSLSFTWDMRQTHVENGQEKFLDKMASYLKENADATINIYPQLYEDKEKEYILFYQAKKKYFMRVNEITDALFTMEDSIRVEKMSVKDSFFVKYINSHVKNKLLFTLQDKCKAFLGNNIVNTEYARLAKGREAAFVDYFKARGVHRQVKFRKGVNHVPYNGFSFYKIEYKGELPHDLYKAYSKMNDLDDSPPRRRFRKERRKEKGNIIYP